MKLRGREREEMRGKGMREEKGTSLSFSLSSLMRALTNSPTS